MLEEDDPLVAGAAEVFVLDDPDEESEPDEVVEDFVDEESPEDDESEDGDESADESALAGL